jgi:hypothetical protein
MAAIPGRIERGERIRSTVGYARYSRVTWNWWCERNDARFVLLDRPLGGDAYGFLPPTMQRWLAPDSLVQEFGPEIEIILVDADTMIRWDAPSPFAAAAGRLSAVPDSGLRWIANGLKAFQHLFPDVTLPWWEFFNSGVVVMNASHAPVMKSFVEFVSGRWPEIQSVIQASDVGTDQPMLNYYLRSVGESVHFLPRPFNLQQCLNVGPAAIGFDSALAHSPPEDIVQVLSLSWLFDFVDLGYVWHFTNVLESREMVMKETWRRIRHNYPGMSVD